MATTNETFVCTQKHMAMTKALKIRGDLIENGCEIERRFKKHDLSRLSDQQLDMLWIEIGKKLRSERQMQYGPKEIDPSTVEAVSNWDYSVLPAAEELNHFSIAKFENIGAQLIYTWLMIQCDGNVNTASDFLSCKPSDIKNKLNRLRIPMRLCKDPTLNRDIDFEAWLALRNAKSNMLQSHHDQDSNV